MNFFLREAGHEFRAGLRNGILPLIYLVLTGYILLVMTSADSLRSMGAVDIPRNAPALVYLMTAGDAFFLFFAWAWVFAQPIVRDRTARLQEIVLAAPVSLRALLAARYVGALGVALLLGTSQIAGFLLAPLLEAAGALPPGSVAPAPWFAFGWAFLIFTLPLAAGAGALYFVAAMKTRGVGGPFAVAAALMACWMVAMIVLKEGHADPFLVTVLDPSGFAEVEHRVVDHWTPHEKSTAVLPLVPALAWNRAIWGLLPLVLLAFMVRSARREALVLERAEKAESRRWRDGSAPAATAHAALPGPIRRAAWPRAALAEALWQVEYILVRRWLWPTLGLLAVLAVAAGFVHGVQHAWGPMAARPEFISPVLARTFYLIVVFMVAALVGLIARRDEQPGLGEMFDAAPAPDGVRLAGRAAAALAASAACVLVPALGALFVGLLTGGIGGTASVILPLAYQFTVLLPPILELAAVTLLLHALIRHAGTAHAAAVLAAFIAVVNHEVELVGYPPHQIGIGVPIALSGLTGFAAWSEKLLAGDGFKLAVAALLLALTAMATRRGTDEGWQPRLRHLRASAFGLAGIGAVAAAVALGGFSAWLHRAYVVDGGYETDEETLAKDAAWEKRWLPRQAAFSVAGGEVALTIDPAARALRGDWRLDGVRAAGKELHARLPNGFELIEVRVGGQPVTATAADDHLAIPLAACPEAGCAVDIAWRLSAAGWDAERRPSWLVGDAWWLRAADVMPRLGLDADRVPRVPADRLRHGLPAAFALPAHTASLPVDAAAPAGHWRWRVAVTGVAAAQGGEIHGLLDFAALFAPADARRSEADGLALIHDASRGADAAAIAADVAAMRACVARHLDGVPEVAAVAQWPRGLPPGTAADAALSGKLLLLAEDPHWDIAGRGTGRHARRADIAAALARRVVLDAADLRQGPGALWLSAGLPGAIGLLCVAEADGAAALQALLGRGAVRVTQDLAMAEVPVGPLAAALTDDWAAPYAPLAALAWTARQTPASLAALLTAVRAGQDVAGPLAAAVGAERAALFLGPPNAVDLHARDGAASGERWRWEGGGWQPAGPAAAPWRVGDEAAPLWLEDWPAYEREPGDNRPRL